MIDVRRSTCLVATDSVASRFLTLHQRIMASLTYSLDIAEVEEQRLVSLVCLPVVGDSGAAMMSIALYYDTAATLTGVQVAEERLLADAVMTAPARIIVEFAILLGLLGSMMRTASHCTSFEV